MSNLGTQSTGHEDELRAGLTCGFGLWHSTFWKSLAQTGRGIWLLSEGKDVGQLMGKRWIMLRS